GAPLRLVAFVAVVAGSAGSAWFAFGALPGLDALILLPGGGLVLIAVPRIVCFRGFFALCFVAGGAAPPQGMKRARGAMALWRANDASLLRVMGSPLGRLGCGRR